MSEPSPLGLREGDDLREVIEKLRGNLEYYNALEYCLYVKTRPLGHPGDPETMYFDFADCEVTVAHNGRTVELTDDQKLLHAEVDHRGASHGVDAWVAETTKDPTPEGVVVDTALESGVVDG